MASGSAVGEALATKTVARCNSIYGIRDYISLVAYPLQPSGGRDACG